MTGGKVRFFRWETGGRNPKNGGENVENTTPSSGLRFYPFSIGYPVVFHRFSTRFSTPVSAWKKHISGARFRFRGRWRRVRKGSMEDGRRRGTGERNVPVPVRPICPFHVPVRSCGFPKRRFGENESKDRKNRRRFRKNRSKERNEGSSQRQGKKNAVAKKKQFRRECAELPLLGSWSMRDSNSPPLDCQSNALAR